MCTCTCSFIYPYTIVLSVKSFEKIERVRVDFIKYIQLNFLLFIHVLIYGHMYVDSPLVRYTSAARAKRFGNASSNFVSACTRPIDGNI